MRIGELVAAEPGHGVARAQAARRRSPIAMSSSSPVAWPKRSLTVLEVVEVDEQHRHERGPRRAGRAARVRRRSAQQGAVGQAGERVVEGLAAQLVLAPPPLGRVAQRHRELGTLPHARQGVDHGLDRAPLVAADDADLERRRAPARVGQRDLDAFAVSRVDLGGHRRADDVLRGPAEQLAPGAERLDDRAVAFEHEQRVRRGGQQRAVARLAGLAALLLGAGGRLGHPLALEPAAEVLEAQEAEHHQQRGPHEQQDGVPPGARAPVHGFGALTRAGDREQAVQDVERRLGLVALEGGGPGPATAGRGREGAVHGAVVGQRRGPDGRGVLVGIEPRGVAQRAAGPSA